MDNTELEKIYEESYRAVYWTAMSLLKDEDEAQDIVQETYVALISSYSSIRDKDKVYGWLKKTAANKCLNRLTRTKTVNTGDEFLEAVEALPEDFLPDSIVESDEMRKIIMDIIDNSLSEDIRTTLVLYYFDEMSTKEIASALGIPQGTVLWRLSFAKKKIKQEVEKYEKDNNDKLYAMAVIPFLTKLFTAEADNVPMRPMPASLIPESASSVGSAAKKISASSSSKVVAKKGMSALAKNVLIGVAALVVASVVIVAIVRHINVEDPHYVAHTTVLNDDQVSGDYWLMIR
ncbi:MAG: sigma-70 family RNA polymerase sigma factor [Saccharofermentans sp.]|nr:sigma-70 family RNA polymerase sigma factor [Saccharofermentans sp.]